MKHERDSDANSEPGLSFAAASQVIFMDPFYDPFIEFQAICIQNLVLS